MREAYIRPRTVIIQTESKHVKRLKCTSRKSHSLRHRREEAYNMIHVFQSRVRGRQRQTEREKERKVSIKEKSADIEKESKVPQQ